MFALSAKFWRGYAYVILYSFALRRWCGRMIYCDTMVGVLLTLLQSSGYVALTQEDHIPSFTSCQGTVKNYITVTIAAFSGCGGNARSGSSA